MTKLGQRGCIAPALIAVAGLALTSLTPVFAAQPAPVVSSGMSAAFDQDIAEAKSAMMSDPRAALDHARRADAETGKAPDGSARRLASATAAWLQAEALYRQDQAAPALPIVDKALGQILPLQPDSKLAGDLVMVHGKLSAALGRVPAALTDYQRAYRIFGKAGAPRSQAIALQQIGSIYEDARDYAHVLQYYRQSAETYGGDQNMALAAHNNLGEAYKDMGRNAEAEAEYRQALALARGMKSAKLEAEILNNIAGAQIAGGRLDAAEASVRQAVKIATDEEAAEERPFLWGQEGVIAFRRGRLKEAAGLIDRAFAGVKLDATEPPFLDFHRAGYEVFSRLGDNAKALAHLKAAKRLEDAARDLAASTNAALMSAQFDFANQDLKIARLKAEELQKSAQARLVITAILGAAGTLFTGLVTMGFFQMRRSRNEVRAANTQLEATNTALEKALKAKTEFLATTSHEIRTPLNGILGMTEVLLADSALSPPARERLKLVHSSGQAMRSMVDDLLDVAKNEQEGVEVRKSELDLHRLLNEVVATWRDQVGIRGLELRTDVSAAPRRIVEDGERLRQMLSNLMSNAIKFTETGWVGLSARAEGQALVLEVADSGIGIAPEDRARIFDSFVQVDSSTVRRYAGTGLGLSICRNIVDAMGGRIAVDGTIGQGSVFTVILPLQAVETSALDAEEVGGACPLDRAAILIVQANPMASSMMRAALQGEARTVETVSDLPAAEAASAVQAFDRVVVDGPSVLATGEPAAVAAALAALAPQAALLVLADPKDEAGLAALRAEARLSVLVKPVAKPALVAALKAAAEPAETPIQAVA